MQIREEVKQLWELCFNDSPEFIEMYFRLRYTNETNIAIFEKGKVISALQMIPYPMTFLGTEIQTSYISGACTHPDFRGKGIMARLLSDSFTRMAAGEIPLSILIPAEPGLYNYYARMGYSTAFFRSRILQHISGPFTPAEDDLHFEHTTEFKQEVFDYFTQKAYERSNYVQHTKSDFKVILEDLSIGQGGVTIAYKNNTSICGVLFSYPEEKTLRIRDYFSNSESIKEQLIHETAHHYRCNQVEYFEQPDNRIEKEPFGMARIIHAEPMLHLYAAAHPKAKINIALTDEQLDYNNGYYYIDKGKCFSGNKEQDCDYLKLNIQQLSKLVFDQINLYMSLMLD